MAAQAFAVVAGKHDESVWILAGLTKRRQDFADLPIHPLHHPVVIVQIKPGIVAPLFAGNADGLGHEVILGCAVVWNVFGLIGIDGHARNSRVPLCRRIQSQVSCGCMNEATSGNGPPGERQSQSEQALERGASMSFPIAEPPMIFVNPVMPSNDFGKCHLPP